LSRVLFAGIAVELSGKKVFQLIAKPKTVDINQLFSKTNLPIISL